MKEVVYTPPYNADKTAQEVPNSILNNTFTYPVVNQGPTVSRDCKNISALNEATHTVNETVEYTIGTVSADSILQHWDLSAHYRLQSGAITDGQQFRIDIRRSGTTIMSARVICPDVRTAAHDSGNPNIVLKTGDIVYAVVIANGIPGGGNVTLRVFVAVTVQPYL